MHKAQTVAASLLALVAASVHTPASEASFPGGNGRIAFVDDYRVRDIQPSGRGARALTPPNDTPGTPIAVGSPAYSPDGRRIALEADDEIFVMAADGSRLKPLREEPHGDPAFSPDGKRIVAEYGEGLMSFDSRDGRRGHSFAGTEAETPAWSTSGLIAFTNIVHWGSEDDCGYGLGPDLSDIYVANSRGKHQWRLTNTYGSSDPDWSPDGRKLAFSRNRTLDRSDVLRSDDSLRAADEMCKLGAPAHREVEAGSESDVYVIGADGRGMRRLIRNAHSPAWSPDGTQITFVRAGWIYLADADGSDRRRLTKGMRPTWQPLR